MRTRITVVCLSVCYQSPGSFSRVYHKLDIPVYSTSFSRFPTDCKTFHSGDRAVCTLILWFPVIMNGSVYYFWFLTVTMLFLPTQQIQSIVMIVDGVASGPGD